MTEVKDGPKKSKVTRLNETAGALEKAIADVTEKNPGAVVFAATSLDAEGNEHYDITWAGSVLTALSMLHDVLILLNRELMYETIYECLED